MRTSFAGTVAETAYIGVATQFVVDTAAGTVHVFAQNMRRGRARARAGIDVVLSWSPGVDVRRRPDGSRARRRTHEPDG